MSKSRGAVGGGLGSLVVELVAEPVSSTAKTRAAGAATAKAWTAGVGLLGARVAGPV